MIDAREAPALLGLRSPFDLYVRLVAGEPHRRDVDLARALQPGLESYLASRAGLTPGTRSTAPEFPPLRGRPAAIAVEGPLILVEIVLGGSSAPEPWVDNTPPDWVLAVAQAELYAHSKNRAVVGVLDGGVWHAGIVGADVALQRRIVDAADEMLQRVADRRPPPADNLAAVRRLYPHDTEGEIKLSRSDATAWQQLKLYRARANALASKARTLETRLRARIGGHRHALLPGGQRLRLSAHVDSTGRSSRRLIETRR